MDETDGKRQLSITWVTLAYFYVAALFGLFVTVISAIFLAQFIFSGDGDGIGRSAIVVAIGGGVFWWHLKEGLARQDRALTPTAQEGAEAARRSRITLAYYYAAALVGVVIFVIGATQAVNSLIDAITFDGETRFIGGFDLGSGLRGFGADRGDLIADALGQAVGAAIGFGVARWHYDRAQAFEHQG